MSRSALFVTGRYKSLGETYSLARFAGELRRAGWNVHFLAFEFAAGFLRRQQLELTVLGDEKAENRRALDRAVRASPPELVVTADYFLLCFKEMAAVWSSRWLLDLGRPLASFDHMGFHPARHVFRLAFDRRLAARPAQYVRARGAFQPRPDASRQPREVPPTYAEIERLPDEVVALIRSCPMHDPRPDADARVFRFCAAAGESAGPRAAATARAELGLRRGERLVLMPVGSWSVELCRALEIPYYEYLLRLLVRYLRDVPGGVRLLLLNGELGLPREVHGQVTLECLPRVPFDLMRDLTRAADLVLTDNVVSSSLGRAVLRGVPAAALVSSVAARGWGHPTEFEAAFPLSPFVAALLAELETRAPGAVFPFSVFPMGLRDEMAPLLEDNPYVSTFDRLELFDEASTRAALERVLCDGTYRDRMKGRQRDYRSAVERLPDAPSIAESILARAEVRAWA